MQTYPQEEFAAECARILDGLFADYKQALTDEFRQAVASLQPGEEAPRAPKSGDLLKTKAGLEQLAEAKQRATEKVAKAAEKARTSYRSAVGTPDADALAAVQLLEYREGITEEDVSEAVERFGAQLDVFKAIQGVAHRAGVNVYADHPLEHTREIIAELEKRMEKAIAGAGGLTDAYLAILKETLGDIGANRDFLGRPYFD